MTKNIITRTIKVALGLAFSAGLISAATGCDETDMQLLSALGNTLAQGASQQQPSSAQQNPASSMSDPTGGMDWGNSANWSGSYAFAYAATKP
ncbi:MAG TPA: hypothetical protein VMV81_14240 [Phycisphaerae bacterium]|nr:hypothetical protein [Phycisphaerae bacterium]